ncbi:MAG: hypothetical protein GTO24_09835 [candidate division Zixibacteria bacterium]|nr:hypothetical protein [candidate division Zixibacteria bacterium]
MARLTPMQKPAVFASFTRIAVPFLPYMYTTEFRIDAIYARENLKPQNFGTSKRVFLKRRVRTEAILCDMSSAGGI